MKLRTTIKNNQILIASAIVLVLLQIPNLFESYWYGDEGIYAALARLIHEDRLLYSQVWDHKPPFIIWYYGIFDFLGWTVGFKLLRVSKIVFTLLSLLFLNKIFSKFKFSQTAKIVGNLLGVAYLGTTLLEGNVLNAEVIFLPITLGVIYLFLNKRVNYYLIGLFTFLSFIIKLQGFLEVGVVVVVFLLIEIKNTKSLKQVFTPILQVCVGFLVPLIVMSLYFALRGNFMAFIESAFIHNFVYSDNNHLATNFVGENHLIIIALTFLFNFGIANYLFFKNKLPQRYFIIINVLNIELFGALLGGRNYLHYFYQLIPGFVLFAATFTDDLKNLTRHAALRGLTFGWILIIGFVPYYIVFQNGPHPENYAKRTEYYQSFWNTYVRGDDSANFWWANSRAEEIVNYINSNFSDSDKMYIYSNDSWILALVDVDITNKFVASYHLGYAEEHEATSLMLLENSDYILFDQKSQYYKSVNEVLQDRKLIYEQGEFKLYQ